MDLRKVSTDPRDQNLAKNYNMQLCEHVNVWQCIEVMQHNDNFIYFIL